MGKDREFDQLSKLCTDGAECPNGERQPRRARGTRSVAANGETCQHVPIQRLGENPLGENSNPRLGENSGECMAKQDDDEEVVVEEGVVNFRARKGQVAYWREAAGAQELTLSAWLKGLATREANAIFDALDKKHGNRNGKNKP